MSDAGFVLFHPTALVFEGVRDREDRGPHGVSPARIQLVIPFPSFGDARAASYGDCVVLPYTYAVACARVLVDAAEQARGVSSRLGAAASLGIAAADVATTPPVSKRPQVRKPRRGDLVELSIPYAGNGSNGPVSRLAHVLDADADGRINAVTLAESDSESPSYAGVFDSIVYAADPYEKTYTTTWHHLPDAPNPAETFEP